MIIAISGAPGVGKSRAASALSKLLGSETISITDLVNSGKIPYTWDRARKTKVIAARDVRRAVNRATKQKRGDFIVEGHLAHLLKADVIVVLRCNPVVLRRRLRARRWPASKVEENVQAEMLDIITAEALGRRGARVYEIDTTSRSSAETARIIARIIKSAKYAKKFRPGKMKWLKPALF